MELCRSKSKKSTDPFDDLFETGDPAGQDDGLSIPGMKGCSSLLCLSHAIVKAPDKWSAEFDSKVMTELGCDVTGMPWIVQEYGRWKLKFRPQMEDLERMWVLPTCTASSARATGPSLGPGFAKA